MGGRGGRDGGGAGQREEFWGFRVDLGEGQAGGVGIAPAGEGRGGGGDAGGDHRRGGAVETAPRAGAARGRGEEGNEREEEGGGAEELIPRDAAAKDLWDTCDSSGPEILQSL